jgi:hypothetical protein
MDMADHCALLSNKRINPHFGELDFMSIPRQFGIERRE